MVRRLDYVDLVWLPTAHIQFHSELTTGLSAGKQRILNRLCCTRRLRLQPRVALRCGAGRGIATHLLDVRAGEMLSTVRRSLKRRGPTSASMGRRRSTVAAGTIVNLWDISRLDVTLSRCSRSV